LSIEPISDAGDPRLEPYRDIKLDKRGGAKSARLGPEPAPFLVEGRLVIESALRAPGFRVVSLLATHAALAHLGEREVGIDPAIPVYLVDRPLMAQLSGVRFHQGCVALAEQRQRPALDVFYGAQRVVVLEQVSDPDNVGGIFRSAMAFGVQGVLLSPGCASPLYRKTSRTSMGAVFQVPFLELAPWPQELERLRAAGFRCIGLTPAAAAVAIDDFDPGDDKIALVFGSEGFGLSSDLQARLDEQVRIPMITGADSLNVATSVGIALHRLGIVSAHGSI
jgi:tRNA G18 (ribose-2'-O)-methylase SpoU